MTERIATLPGGIRVAVRGPRHQQKQWLRGRYYEAPMLAYIRKHYHGGTFVDGGACIGNHTLFCARFCADQVIAVEPVARNMEHLMDNIALSGLAEYVTPVQAALGEEPGRGAMEHAGRYHGQYNLVNGDDVEITTLDSIAALARHPITLVKLDIEGSEILALRGSRHTLECAHPVLFVESLTRDQLAAVDGFLAGLGYERMGRFAQAYEYRWNGT